MSSNVGRRGLFQRAVKLGSVALLAPLAQVVPEAHVRFPEMAPGANKVDLNDPEARRLMALVQRTKEWKQLRGTLVSETPSGFATHKQTGAGFLTFVQWDATGPARSAEPFRVLQAIEFGFHPSGDYAVVHITPDADGRGSTLREIRSGEMRYVEHSAQTRAILDTARARAIELKVNTPGRKLPPVASVSPGYGCDCYPSKFYCGQYISGGGYVDHECALGCNISCAFFGTPWFICIPVCEAACWVPPYTTCAWYYCGPCLY
jgi:hypothetical protein